MVWLRSLSPVRVGPGLQPLERPRLLGFVLPKRTRQRLRSLLSPASWSTNHAGALALPRPQGSFLLATCRKRMRQSATVGACERHGRTKTPRERSPTCSESSFDTAKRARCPATARQGPPLVAIEFQDPRNRKRDRFDIGLRLGACLNHTLRPRFPTLRRFRYVWIRRRHC